MLVRGILIATCIWLWGSPGPALIAQTAWVAEANGKLVYVASSRGDRIPDFSYCGYEGGSKSLPLVAATIGLTPSGGDDTRAIQRVIDRLASAPLSATGWRGVIQLSADRFLVSGTLRLHGDHVVLRGTQTGETRTIIEATGHARRPLIVLGDAPAPTNPADPSTSKLEPADEQRLSRVTHYVPVGARVVPLDKTQHLRVGQRVVIGQSATAEWIAAVGMNQFPNDDGRSSWLDWKPGTLDHAWERTIVGVSSTEIELDAPLTAGLDPQLSPAFVAESQRDAGCHHIGLENLTLISHVQTDINPKDEEHAWDGIRLNTVTDAWIRAVHFEQFAGSAVNIGQQARRVTVTDCKSRNPVSEEAGWRRHTYYTLGQQTLFLRCQADQGRHDFSTGPLTTGPNAFVYCTSRKATNFSGPIGSWASGVLYDNVEIDGAGLALTNLETASQGTGWTAANCVLWNCVAPQIICRRPPTAFNWAIGVWGEVVGDGIWSQLNEFASPESLYVGQLRERVGAELSQALLTPVENFPNIPADLVFSKCASEAGELVRQEPSASGGLRLVNGWLAMGDGLAIGSRQSLTWWRGSILPAKASEFGLGVTRFVPGRDEPYYTDVLSDVAASMQARGDIVLEHHWGLWYDRRRDDHQMVRRLDGDVWPPFYEQPWARSGQGTAWDGLSRFDLTRFNVWYFDRLKQFAELADAHDLILMQYMYFQHNILEAGAHWADFPWRPANSLQATGFPEPPIYENRKRVFMAEDFYDVEHPVRRALHTRYIRHCLDTLGESKNVLFVLSQEYTGPVTFVRFWLDNIRQWELEHNRQVLVVLSTCRDVQEAILDDPYYAQEVDVIDIKYWWYTADGSMYAPPASTQRSPRQQLREWQAPKNPSVESLSRSIREQRLRFPEKAVLCSVPHADPWATLASGGSLPSLPLSTDRTLLSELLKSLPRKDGNELTLFREEKPCLLLQAHVPEHSASKNPVAGQQSFTRMDRATGQAIRVTLPTSNKTADPLPASQLPDVVWRTPN